MTINDCVIRDNESTAAGSGILNTGARGVLNLNNVQFAGNTGVSFLNSANGIVNSVDDSTIAID